MVEHKVLFNEHHHHWQISIIMWHHVEILVSICHSEHARSGFYTPIHGNYKLKSHAWSMYVEWQQEHNTIKAWNFPYYFHILQYGNYTKYQNKMALQSCAEPGWNSLIWAVNWLNGLHINATTWNLKSVKCFPPDKKFFDITNVTDITTDLLRVCSRYDALLYDDNEVIIDVCPVVHVIYSWANLHCEQYRLAQE